MADTSRSKTPEASSSIASSSTPSAMPTSTAAKTRQPSEEAATWLRTREDDGVSEAPSEAPTPSAVESTEMPPPPSLPPTPAARASMSRPSGRKSVDAEDEDVRIAIAALGAMRHLDGRKASGGSTATSWNDEDEEGHQGSSKSAGMTFGRSNERGSNASNTGNSSAISTASFASTADSSPSSTPATELTLESSATPACSVTSLNQPSSSDVEEGSQTGRSEQRAATLADLPSDFQFPAIVQDENGNEVEVDKEMMRDADFLNRVSHLPIVRGTLRAYEMGKQRSKIVKYGGGFVESSVKAISRPVVGRLGASLGDKGKEQLDDFACRQLNRVYPNKAESVLSKEERQQMVEDLDQRERTEWAHMTEEERTRRRKAYWALQLEEKEREMVVSELRQRKGKSKAGEGETSARTERKGDGSITTSTASSTGSSQRSTGNRDGRRASVASAASPSYNEQGRALVEQATKDGTAKGWSSVLVEAGATAGGLSAAMSEESMKKLKYCLQWLQYATAHIEHQITELRDLIVKLNHGELELTSPAVQSLTAIKGDVVNTIRSVVDVVGKYTGGALPEPARTSVKAFILSLPARWATVNRSPAVINASSFGGSPASPSFSPAHMGRGSSSSAAGSPSSSSSTLHGGSRDSQMSAAATAQAANRVLTLAVESLDILRSVTVVVGESLDRADLWVERLRMVGLQRKRHLEQDAIEGPSHPGASSAGRIEAASWENARGLASHRRQSIGAGSDVSMGTSASTKRRRMRGDDDEGSGSTPHNRLPGPSQLGAGSLAGNGGEMGSTSVAYGRPGAHYGTGMVAGTPSYSSGSGHSSPAPTSSAAAINSRRRRGGAAMNVTRSTQGGPAVTPTYEFSRQLE